MRYSYIKEGYIYKIKCDDGFVKTPGGNEIITSSESFTKRFIKLLTEECPNSVYNIYSMILDKYSHEEHGTVLNSMLKDVLEDTSTPQLPENIDFFTELKWYNVYGFKEERTNNIISWLNKCSLIQLSAITFIHEHIGSYNIAYIIAVIIERIEDTNKAYSYFKELHDFYADTTEKLIDDKGFLYICKLYKEIYSIDIHEGYKTPEIW